MSQEIRANSKRGVACCNFSIFLNKTLHSAVHNKYPDSFCIKRMRFKVDAKWMSIYLMNNTIMVTTARGWEVVITLGINITGPADSAKYWGC